MMCTHLWQLQGASADLRGGEEVCLGSAKQPGRPPRQQHPRTPSLLQAGARCAAGWYEEKEKEGGEVGVGGRVASNGKWMRERVCRRRKVACGEKKARVSRSAGR